MPIDTYWVDLGAIIHVNLSMQDCLHCRKLTCASNTKCLRTIFRLLELNRKSIFRPFSLSMQSGKCYLINFLMNILDMAISILFKKNYNL